MKTFHADSEPSDSKRERLRYRCLANGCPMAGAIFMNGTDAPGVCSLHYANSGSDMSRITEVLRNWDCITFALENARRFLNDPAHCGDVKAERTMLDAQWAKLQRSAPDWTKQLRPHGTTLSDWARQLLAFLAWRINCDVHNRLSAWQWPPAQSRTVRDMRSRVRTVRPPDPDETPLSDAEAMIAEREMQ